MKIKMKSIMSNSVTRFFFRFVKKANIILSTGKVVDFERQNGMCCIIILSTGKVLDFERQHKMCCIVHEENLSEIEEQEMLQLMLI